jgi:predicted Zn-dependent protease
MNEVSHSAKQLKRNPLGFLGACVLTVSALTATLSCQTSPTGREQFVAVPEGQVDGMGVQAFSDLKSKQPINHDAATNAYVKCVADAITAVLPEKQEWEVVVFESKEVNAFALPGGKIGVYTGILPVASTPEQLGAVLGHEVGHVLAQHGRERISQQMATQGLLALTSAMFSNKESGSYQLVMAGLGLGAQFGVLLPFSRTQESEADLIGLQLMAKAGFDPHQSIILWQNMSKMAGGAPPAWMSDHPSNDARIQQLQDHMNEAVSMYNASGRRPNCRR